MSASKQLNHYIQTFARRWQKLVLGRGLFFAIAAFVTISLVAAYFAVESGFDNQYFWLGRAFLLVATLLVVYFGLLRPLKAIRIASVIETRGASFSGRIRTYTDLQSAEQNPDSSANPMSELLAADALSVAQSVPEESLLGQRELSLPYIASGVALVLLIAMLIAGPGLMNYSLRYLYAGWAFNELLPPQTIQVVPGDTLVKRGGNVQLRARAEGFKTDNLTLHVKTADSDWQQVRMSAISGTDDQYDFSFFSVREEMQYYIQSGAVRTPNYDIDVIDLPGITSIQMTYKYPEWTQLEDETLDRIGDITVLPGTEVSIEVFTDSELPAGELVLNDQAQTMEIDGTRAVSAFTVNEQGDYYLTAVIGNEQVRLSDDYFIRLQEDGKPEIEFGFPARDWNASNIEEVSTELSVKDDFGVETIELVYAVNGGDWTTVDLKASNNYQFEKDQQQRVDHLFYLEDFRVDEDVFDPIDYTTTTETVPLQPGDLISYYARVSDREQSEQTDIFFIEVQPFDRRFSQAEQGGGGGMGAGQGAGDIEISQRQRDIIVSTWNLIREQTESSAGSTLEDIEGRISDSTKLLAQLQRSLAEQAESLIETVRSRQLTADDRVENYVRHIDNAIDSMYPASDELSSLNLEEAIGPQQSALQHLLRADAVFNEFQVSNNNAAVGQGGGQGGARDQLAEMFELEIDLDRNQYETGSRATLEQQAEQVDENLRALEDLARRQQQLAESMRNRNQFTEAERYQQEMLRREAEQLEQQINQQQAQNNPGQQASGAQQNAGEQSAGSESNVSGSESSGDASSAEQSSRELNNRLQSAMEAMERASEAMRNGDVEQLQRDASEAQRQLQGAGEQLTEDQELQQLRDFERMAREAQQLYQDQSAMEQTLLDGVDEAIANMDPETEYISSPFSYSEELDMADEKRGMIERLQRLKEQMQNNAAMVRSEEPSVARTLDNADQNLNETEVAIRMDLAATYMSRGEALYVANSEGVVTNALRSLRDSTDEALRLLRSEDTQQSSLETALDNLRAGRSELQNIAQDAQAGSGSQTGSETGEQTDPRQANGDQTDAAQNDREQGTGQGALAEDTSGQGEGRQSESRQASTGQGTSPASGEAGAEGQPGQQSGSAQGNGQENGDPQNGGQRNTGVAGTNWGGWATRPELSEDARDQLNRQLRQAVDSAGNLVPELRARSVDEQAVREIQQLVRELQNRGISGFRDPGLIELNETLSLLEELESRVEQSLSGDDQRVRTESPEIIPAEFREAVADYYRRLSNDKDSEVR